MLRVVCLAAIAALLPAPAHAYDFDIGESGYLEIKGDVTYSLKLRTENADSELVNDSKGNSNFDKGDLVNNKAIARMETVFDAPWVTLFGKFEAFYDDVYTDKDKYPDGTNIAKARDYAERNILAQEFYVDLHSDRTTLRVGKQIVEWGELAAPVFAPGVNVINLYDGTRIGSAGYTVRDYKVPSESAWLITEIDDTLSVEGIYSRDFEPRATLAVVGTFGSFFDFLGYGGPTILEDARPRKASDMEQYGLAVRKLFPAAENLELGLYWANYLHSFPINDIGTGQTTYEETEMFGLTLSRVLKKWQVYGEFTYRPDHPAQIALQNLGGAPVGGFDEVSTFNWGLGFMRLYTDYFPSLPYTVSFTPLIEVYGGINLDYHDLDDDPDRFYDIPEHTAYYLANFTFASPDMIDNTTVTFTAAFSGGIHKEENGFHSLGATLKARVGNNMEYLLGYDIKLGDPEEAGLNDYPGYIPDRDALTLGFTWYFM
ncbi:MAG: DUF1302 family protein [Halioglobus sp.]|nr:DUF1302 family protein [Halioglobus sp.]